MGKPADPEGGVPSDRESTPGGAEPTESPQAPNRQLIDAMANLYITKRDTMTERERDNLSEALANLSRQITQ